MTKQRISVQGDFTVTAQAGGQRFQLEISLYGSPLIQKQDR